MSFEEAMPIEEATPPSPLARHPRGPSAGPREVAEGASGGRAARSTLLGSPSLDKPIYTISVAAEILDIHPRTLMMYESLGLVVPQRTPTNRRRFSQRDIHKLQAILTLTRRHGINLTGVRYVLVLLKALHDHGVPPPDPFKDLDVSGLKM